jgi:catechol 2,3-dioxygenase
MKAFLPEQTRISQVHLRTANLERALVFYSEALGLKGLNGPGARVSLSISTERPDLIVLSEDRNALSRPSGTTGLYHVALRYPSREGLALAFQRLARTGCTVAGASDHGVSEAIYLSDPDGNGVELYADRPRARWRWRDGQVTMTTRALNLEDLLATASDHMATAGPPLQIELGHVHLQVTDLAAAERFYGEFLGFSVTQRSYPGALFFAAGRYHHHVAVNVWGGRAAPPSGSVGLVSYRLQVPCAEILYCLSHRAPLLGYETRSASAGDGTTVLQIRDLNGAWLELQPSPAASASWRDIQSCPGHGAMVLS